jgi:hypothetical protein|tara:strand:- start:730 stop:1164 length:435 start_codon:yes stop_codon:yes gene_type:complete
MEITNINSILDLILGYKNIIIWLGSLSLFIFIFSLVGIRQLVALIPSDYFLRKKYSKLRSSNLFLWLLISIFKNIIGYSLIIGGIIMLILPGQGLFTIIIGLMLSNYPGKYALEKKLISTPSILKSINWLRKKSNKPPLIVNGN